MLAWWCGKRVAMTDMPQMIALYNGMGGGAAAAIAAVELFGGKAHGSVLLALGGARRIHRRGVVLRLADRVRQAAGAHQEVVPLRRPAGTSTSSMLAVMLVVRRLGRAERQRQSAGSRRRSSLLALLLGVTMTLPIGGADMPVVISLYNAFTGLAVGFEGFVLENAAMIIAGTWSARPARCSHSSWRRR